MNMFIPFLIRLQARWTGRCKALVAAHWMLAVALTVGAVLSRTTVAAEDTSAPPAPAADHPAAADRFVAPHPALASAPRRTKTGR
jgi:hypothetical protein